MNSLPVNHPIRKLFAGLTEHAFLTSLGVTDPPLIDYLTELLTRFLHMNDVYRLKDQENRTIDEIPAMVREAELLPAEGRTRREYHRHIGDFALFWIGLFPEALQRKNQSFSRDGFVSYVAIGKRSYFIASTFEDTPFEEESPVLRRLSSHFEMCAYGLNQVRKEFDLLPHEGELGKRIIG